MEVQLRCQHPRNLSRRMIRIHRPVFLSLLMVEINKLSPMSDGVTREGPAGLRRSNLWVNAKDTHE